MAFGAEASGTFVERTGLAAAAGLLRAFAVRDDEAALRGAGAALPRADLAFSFSRVAFSLSLRAVSFSRIAASAAFATCDRPASGAESKASRKALMTLLVPRGGFCQNSRQTRWREMKAEFSLRRFENGEHTGGTTEVKQATAASRDVLVVAGARARKLRSSS